jgi:hypothetical protein
MVYYYAILGDSGQGDVTGTLPAMEAASISTNKKLSTDYTDFTD